MFPPVTVGASLDSALCMLARGFFPVNEAAKEHLSRVEGFGEPEALSIVKTEDQEFADTHPKVAKTKLRCTLDSFMCAHVNLLNLSFCSDKNVESTKASCFTKPFKDLCSLAAEAHAAGQSDACELANTWKNGLHACKRFSQTLYTWIKTKRSHKKLEDFTKVVQELQDFFPVARQHGMQPLSLRLSLFLLKVKYFDMVEFTKPAISATDALQQLFDTDGLGSFLSSISTSTCDSRPEDWLRSLIIVSFSHQFLQREPTAASVDDFLTEVTTMQAYIKDEFVPHSESFKQVGEDFESLRCVIHAWKDVDDVVASRLQAALKHIDECAGMDPIRQQLHSSAFGAPLMAASKTALATGAKDTLAETRLSRGMEILDDERMPALLKSDDPGAEYEISNFGSILDMSVVGCASEAVQAMWEAIRLMSNVAISGQATFLMQCFEKCGESLDIVDQCLWIFLASLAATRAEPVDGTMIEFAEGKVAAIDLSVYKRMAEDLVLMPDPTPFDKLIV